MVFVVHIGVVSLFSNMTYEAARRVNLISFHLQHVGDPAGAIPILYAVAM